MFHFCKLQICCLITSIFLGIIYDRETKRRGKKYQKCNPLFDLLLILVDFEILFDGITAVTVNYLDIVPLWVNKGLHLVFYILLDSIVFLYFILTLVHTDNFYSNKKLSYKILVFTPFIISIIVDFIFINKIEFIQGNNTNYSMGISAITCFVMVAVYLASMFIFIICSWNYISKRNRYFILLFLIIISGFMTFQIVFPESLVTSIAALLSVLAIYLIHENPLYGELADYNKEMVMGFATLVENRDDNTGGHIRRTSAYVELLTKEIRRRGLYEQKLTADYINNLTLATPMHDIGKIAIPDSILQKPGRLTPEEFSIMKTHSVRGGDIILETFGETAEHDFMEMAYKVAMYHHEKWNGNGYPEGLSGKDIPLAARIMAIADVFDAVTEKRCYKEALPLEQSFEIIKNGAGTDFDPELVPIFLDIKDQIVEVHHQICQHRDKD